MCVKYVGGCSVHQGVFSTSRGYHEYIGGCSVHQGDTMSTSGDIMSTLGDIMMHVGEQVGKTFQFLLKTPMY